MFPAVVIVTSAMIRCLKSAFRQLVGQGPLCLKKNSPNTFVYMLLFLALREHFFVYQCFPLYIM